MSRGWWIVASLVVAMAGAFAPAAWAQVATVEVALTLPGGEPVPDQPVVLVNPAIGFSNTTPTNSQGRARFTAVPAADDYRVLVDGQELATGIRLRANESRAVALIQSLPEILVTARPGRNSINAIDAEVGAGFAERELRAQPVEARDLFRALVRLPNVVPSTGFFPEAPAVSINGANGLYAQYLIDGMDNNENFLGGPKFPISTGFVQDVTVLSSSYSAEYGRTGSGLVNVTSKSGSNEWQGEAFYLLRPGQPLDSNTKYAGRDLTGNSVKDGFERNQYGFGLGGPLIRDRTFFYANVEYAKDDKDNLLSSPALGVNTTVAGENTALLSSLKLDHRLSNAWWLSFRVNHGDIKTESQGGGLDGGVTFPSAGFAKDRDSTLTALTAVYDGEGFTSETTLGWSQFKWDYGRPLGGAGAQVTAQGPDGLVVAVLGNPGFAFDERERTWQWQQKFTVERGAHTFKFGADLLRADFQLDGGGNPDGNLTVRLDQFQLDQLAALNLGAALDVSDLPGDATVVGGTTGVEVRPASFGSNQDLTGLYVQDQFTLSPRLTITAGLRWDYDSVSRAGSSSGDDNNFAPRFAVNYGLTDTVALRAGVGLYYQKLPYAILSDALQQNTDSAAFRGQLQQLIDAGFLPADTNLDRVTFDGNLTVNPACATLNDCLAITADPALRETTIANERRILNPDGLDNPSTWQVSLGPQWQVTPEVVASADFIYAHGLDQLRLQDLNAPPPFPIRTPTAGEEAELRAIPDAAARQSRAIELGLVQSVSAADGQRPVQPVAGGARKIVVTKSDGQSTYYAVNLRLAKDQGADIYGYTLSYTWSKNRNNTDDINFQAANFNDFGSEWGPSVNDRQHVISTILYLYPRDDLTLSVAGLFQSGQPINYIPDTAVFGTTDLNGDGASFSDAYLGNADRSPGSSRNSGRLGWSETVDLGLRFAPRIGRVGGRIELSADVFNVFNATNESGFANAANQSNQIQVAGAPFVARNAGPPRQYQFGLRYLFE